MILRYNAFILFKIIMFYTYIHTNSVPNYLLWYNNFVHCVKVCRMGTPFYIYATFSFYKIGKQGTAKL